MLVAIGSLSCAHQLIIGKMQASYGSGSGFHVYRSIGGEGGTIGEILVTLNH
jgi:hypothetical protein